jgi:magnesium chelatase family protein
MTIARIATFAFAGIDAQAVEVQVQIAPGLPAFLVVGLPDKAVAESRERVRAALLGMGLSLPPKRVLVNLAPRRYRQGRQPFRSAHCACRTGRDGCAAAR